MIYGIFSHSSIIHDRISTKVSSGWGKTKYAIIFMLHFVFHVCEIEDNIPILWK